MKKANKNTNRGQVLHEVAKAHPRSIKWITEKAGYQYNTFFKHTKQEKLSFSILAKYGKAMRHDFSVQFPEMAEYIPMLHSAEDNKKPTYEELELRVKELTEKLYAILEKNNLLLEENMRLIKEKAANKDLKK